MMDVDRELDYFILMLVSSLMVRSQEENSKQLAPF